MYRAIQDIPKNKKPLLISYSEKGLTTNEEKQQKFQRSIMQKYLHRKLEKNARINANTNI